MKLSPLSGVQRGELMHMKTSYVAICLCSSLLLLTASAPQAIVPASELPHVSTNPALTELLAEQEKAGFSGVLLIDQPGKAQLAYSFAGATVETPVWIGSIAKTLMAAAILKLDAEGQVSLNDTVAEYFPDAPSDKAGITIRQLLTHSSGLPHDYSADGITDRGEAVRAVLAKPLRFEPDSIARYSSDGFSLLAAIAEIASGEPYEDYMRRTVLEPAAISDSGLWPDGLGSPEFLTIAKTPKGNLAGANWGWRGATGISSTAADLVRFVRAFRAGKIVPVEVAKAAMTTQREIRPDNDATLGFGWFITDEDGVQVALHSGGLLPV